MSRSIRLTPSIAGGAATPAARQKVGSRSMPQTGVSSTRGLTPGHFTIKGTRMPPS